MEINYVGDVDIYNMYDTFASIDANNTPGITINSDGSLKVIPAVGGANVFLSFADYSIRNTKDFKVSFDIQLAVASVTGIFILVGVLFDGYWFVAPSTAYDGKVAAGMYFYYDGANKQFAPGFVGIHNTSFSTTKQITYSGKSSVTVSISYRISQRHLTNGVLYSALTMEVYIDGVLIKDSSGASKSTIAFNGHCSALNPVAVVSGNASSTPYVSIYKVVTGGGRIDPVLGAFYR